MEVKLCAKCNIEKEVCEFTKTYGCKTYRSNCKECDKEIKAQHFLKTLN